MKNITKFINESQNQIEQIDESLSILGYITIVGVSILVGALVGAISGDQMLKSTDQGSLLENLKWIWGSKKAKKIVERLAQDPEIQDFLKQSESKQKGKWRKLIESKLDENEIKYLKRIAKTDVRNEINKK